LNSTVVAILTQVLTGVENLAAGKPVTINIPAETVEVGGAKFSVSESVTIQKAA